MIKFIHVIFSLFFLNSCTLQMIQTDTHGTANNVVDDKTTESPNLNVPKI